MKKIVLQGILLFFVISGLAQNNTLPPFDGGKIAKLRLGKIAREVSRNQKKDRFILGNQYLSDDWMYGAITLNDSTALTGKLRYNIYLQQIELLTKDKDTLYLSKVSKVNGIDIGNKKFVYQLYVGKEGGKTYLKKGYFQQLARTGKGQLMIQHFKSVELDSYVSNYMGGGGTKNYYYRHNYDLYFLSDENKRLQKISRMNEVGEILFSEDMTLFREYVKKYNISLRNYTGLMQIAQLYKKLGE